MAFMISFNARSVDPNVAPEPVPTGTYDVVLVETNDKPVQNGNGAMFYEMVMQIISGEFQGRKIYDRLNYKNPNEQARTIAMGTLSSICYVTGVMEIQNSSTELHGKPFRVKVAKVQRGDDNTKFTNEVRGYLDAYGYEPGKNPGAAANATAGGAWGGASASQPAQATQETQAWNGGGQTQPAQATQTQQPDWAAQQQTQAQPAQTTVATGGTPAPAADQTKAVDPRIMALMQMGIPVEQIPAMIAAQDAAAASAAQAQAPAPTQAAATQVVQAPDPAAVDAQIAAMMGGGAAKVDDSAVPEWARS